MRVFISAVSSEFGAARDLVANSLQGIPVEVRVQRSFSHQSGTVTLMQQLHDYIRDADRVIAIVGARSGAFPPEGAVTAEYRALLPGGMARASYTQWEVIFARHFHPGDVFLHRADAEYRADQPAPEDDDPASQAAFNAWLDGLGIAWRPFGSADGLRANVLEIGWQAAPAHKPNNLGRQSIGSLFKGREAFLADLREVFAGGRNAAIASAAMHGLGGVGKTRAAIEFAWTHAADFTALLFISAKTPEELETEIANLVGPLVLNLPDQNDPVQANRFAAALRWLQTNPGWFLIVDNVDTEAAAAAVRALLGRLSGGRVLITTRIANWGASVTPLVLDLLSREASVALLFAAARNRRPEPDAEAEAGRLAEDLGDLSLALEQAAAYVSRRRMTFAAYRAEWGRNRARLIAAWDATMDYPMSVAVTWVTAFEQLSPEARTLLETLAFLSTEPIPEGLITAGEDAAADARRDALAELTGLSLATAVADDDSVTLHRLVQQVARDRMDEATTRARLAAMTELMAAALPGKPQDVTAWPAMLRLEPHARALTTQAGDDLAAPLASVLHGVATMLHGMARYGEAERMYRRALLIREARLGPDHPDVATSLNNLANLLQATGRADEAEPIHRRALLIRERRLGPDHPDVAASLNNLALLLRATGRADEAEPIHRRALAIQEARLGPDHPDVATSLNNLANLLEATGRADEAERMYRRALAIREARLGPDHPDVASSLNNLASLLQATGRADEAEPMYRRALLIREARLGPDHPEVAASLNNLANLLKATGRADEAEPMYRRALLIEEARLGPDHPEVATSLNNLAGLLKATGRADQAEPIHRRALLIRERRLGPDHPDVATSLNNLANLLKATGRADEAEPMYRRALAIQEARLGPDHPDVAGSLNNLAGLLQATGRADEAERMYRRALLILLRFEVATGLPHPHRQGVTANFRRNLARQGRSPGEIARALAEVFAAAGLPPPQEDGDG